MADYKDYAALEAKYSAEIALAKLGWYKFQDYSETYICLYCGCLVKNYSIHGEKMMDVHRRKCNEENNV